MQERSFYGIGDQVYQVKVHEPGPGRDKIPERLLHDIWHHLKFNQSNLTTTEGLSIKLLHPGKLNRDSGPDFIDASLLIDDILWHGTVELHIYSKYWYYHNHHRDKRYNNTILHVTLYEDLHTGTLKRQDDSLIPEVVLYPLLQATLKSLMIAFVKQSDRLFACSSQWSRVPIELKNSWIQSLALLRLDERKESIAKAYLNNPDCEEILHRSLFRALGYDKNSDAMEELAKRIPLSICRLLKSGLDLEALHFGVSGLLPDSPHPLHQVNDSDTYLRALQRRFSSLQRIYDIPVMHPSTWKFFRLRPANFPTLRIAQAMSWLLPGGLLAHDPIGKLYSVSSKAKTINALYNIIQCTTSSFWWTHYHFKKETTPHSQHLGRDRLEKLFINAISPLLLFLAEQYKDPNLERWVMNQLHKLPPEKDHFIVSFEHEGFALSNSIMTQGIHALYSSYCKPVKCMHCQVGDYLLNQNQPL